MRIVVGGIEHETCGFAAPSRTADATALMSVARTVKYGEELRSLGDANTIVEGVFLSLHGAFAADGVDDADGDDFCRLPYTRLGRRMYPM